MALTVANTDQLAEELLSVDARGLKWRLLRLDKRRRLVLFRNMQRNGRWATRYQLPTLGFSITLEEELDMNEPAREHTRNARYRTVAVRIEPFA